MTIEEQLEAAKAETAKLLAEKNTLIAEKRKTQEHAEAAREEAEKAAAEAKAKNGDIDAIKAQHAKELAKLKDQLTADLSARDARLSELLIDNGIKSALVEHNVAPQFHEMATAYFKMQAKLDNGEAKFGDVPLADGIKAYVTSDKGKHFVAAPVNSGGNATGSTGEAPATSMTKANFSQAKFYELLATDKAAANQLATRLEMPWLIAD